MTITEILTELEKHPSENYWLSLYANGDEKVRCDLVDDLHRAASAEPTLALPALPMLAEAIRDQGENALWALDYLGPAAKPAVPNLIEALQHEDPDTCLHAACLLAVLDHMDEALPILLEVLQDYTCIIRWSTYAYETLEKAGPAGKAAVPTLIDNLKQHNVRDIGDFASRALKGILDLEAVPVLIEAVEGEHAEIREAMAEALGDWGPPAAAAVEPLLRVLRNDPVPVVRSHAATALGQIGVASQSVTKTLTEALGDKDPLVRINAAGALSFLQPGDGLALFALKKALRDKDVKVRREAVLSLRQFATPNTAALIPDLIKALRDRHENEHVPHIAGAALGKIGAAAVEPLIAALHDADLQVHYEAAVALELIGQMAKAAIPFLLEMLPRKLIYEKKTFPSATYAAFNALRKIVSAENIEMIPHFVEALKWKEIPFVQRSAAEGLGILGPSAQAAIPALENALTDDDWKVHKAAAEALKKIKQA